MVWPNKGKIQLTCLALAIVSFWRGVDAWLVRSTQGPTLLPAKLAGYPFSIHKPVSNSVTWRRVWSSLVQNATLLGVLAQELTHKANSDLLFPKEIYPLNKIVMKWIWVRCKPTWLNPPHQLRHNWKTPPCHRHLSDHHNAQCLSHSCHGIVI